MNKLYNGLTYILAAVAFVTLGVGFFLSILFLQGLIGGTILYYSYPFIQATLFPGLLANGSLSWLNSVLLLITFKVIFGAGVSLKKDYYANLSKKFKDLKAAMLTDFPKVTAEKRTGYNSLPGSSNKYKNRTFHNKPKKVYGTANTKQ